jgi:hypothetical protein
VTPNVQGASSVLLFFGKQYSADPGAHLPDTDYGTIAYGEFLDEPLWKKTRQTYLRASVPVTAPGATSSATADAGIIAEEEETEERAAAPIAPVLSPVTAPLVNGKDAFAAQTGVGTQPTLSWSAPALGEATSYSVSITEVAVDQSPGNVGGTALSPVFAATFYPSGGDDGEDARETATPRSGSRPASCGRATRTSPPSARRKRRGTS